MHSAQNQIYNFLSELAISEQLTKNFEKDMIKLQGYPMSMQKDQAYQAFKTFWESSPSRPNAWTLVNSIYHIYNWVGQ